MFWVICLPKRVFWVTNIKTLFSLPSSTSGDLFKSCCFIFVQGHWPEIQCVTKNRDKCIPWDRSTSLGCPHILLILLLFLLKLVSLELKLKEWNFVREQFTPRVLVSFPLETKFPTCLLCCHAQQALGFNWIRIRMMIAAWRRRPTKKISWIYRVLEPSD